MSNPALHQYIMSVRYIMPHLVTGSLHSNRYLLISRFILYNSQKNVSAILNKNLYLNLFSINILARLNLKPVFHENCIIHHLNLKHFTDLNLKMLSELFLSFTVLIGDVKTTALGAGPRNPDSCLFVLSLPNMQQFIILVLTSVQQAADKYL